MNKKLVSLLFLFLVTFLTFSTFEVALAGDYINEAVAALQNENVYVAPNTEGTDETTAVYLQGALRTGDNIVLVMLPEGAEVESEEGIAAIVGSLSAGLNDDHIIGLAVGKEVIGYAANLPIGVAADQMNRAGSVSNDPVTALITFAQNMHLWLNSNPQPTATPVPTEVPIPTERPEKSGALSLILYLATLTVVIIFLLSLIRKSIRANSSEGRLSAQKAKDLVEADEALDSINLFISKVQRTEIKGLLGEIYAIARNEIVNEIKEEPHRATAITVLQIKKDLVEFAEVLRLYSQILSGHLNLEGVDSDFKENLETKFFPKVERAFRNIATELDRNDLKGLELLVRSLSNDFRTRGLN